jgi:hypothetical protein
MILQAWADHLEKLSLGSSDAEHAKNREAQGPTFV